MNQYLIQTEKELKIRNYSPKTIKSYLCCLKDYLYNSRENVESVDIDFIRDFLLLKKEKGLLSQTINLYLNAIKFFYGEIIKCLPKIDLKFAKQSNKLPVEFNRRENEKYS